MMKKKYCLLAGAVSAALLFAGCGKSSSQTDYTEEELPYGATLVMDTEHAVPIEYDYRYLDDELVSAITQYYHALVTNDAAEFSALMFPLYHNFELEDLYGGQITDEEIVDNSYMMLHDAFGQDFDAALVDVTELVADKTYSPSLEALYNMLDDLAAEKGAEKVSEHTDKFYELRVDLYLTEKGSGIQDATEFAVPDEQMYALHYDGQWYLIYATNGGYSE